MSVNKATNAVLAPYLVYAVLAIFLAPPLKSVFFSIVTVTI